MPATRTVHSPYSIGQGSASVPVLFSLPNVQPAIAAANTRVATETAPGKQDIRDPIRDPMREVAVSESTVAASSAPFATSSIVVSSGTGMNHTADSWLNKLTSQLTNITIIVLLVAVVGLVYRNQQPSGVPGTPSEPALVAQVPANGPIPGSGAHALPFTETPNANVQKNESDADERPQEALAETPTRANDATVVERESIPLLLAPASQEPSNPATDKSVSEPMPKITTGPYGTATRNTATVSTATGGTSSAPISLTSSKLGNGQADRSRWEAIDTETPSLNTRDIILLRSGQRRTESGVADPGLPKVESVGRTQQGSRAVPSSAGGTPLMTGQSYPPIAPQYEPISMPKPSPSRIIQPSTDASQKPLQKQYIPLSPVLPNPDEANGFDNRNP